MSSEEKNDAAEQEQAAEALKKRAAWRKWFAELAALVAGLLASVAAASSFFLIRGPEVDKGSIGIRNDVERNLKVLEARVAEAQREAQLSAELLKRIENANPASVEAARLRTDVDELRSEVKQLTDAVGLSPEKSLAVPLLRKDMDNLREGYRHDLDAAQSEMNRVYDLNKWFLGTVITMALALVGLAVSNFLQLRK